MSRWAVEIPQGCVGLVFCRSGPGGKHGVSLPNCVGVIDSDYRGELQVPLVNLSREPYTVAPGERIAQLVVAPVCLPVVEEVEELTQTARGEGGFWQHGEMSFRPGKRGPAYLVGWALERCIYKENGFL